MIAYFLGLLLISQVDSSYYSNLRLGVPKYDDANRLSDEVLQDHALCGPNATYMLLKMCGNQVDYDKVRGAFELKPDGVSVLEIQTVLRKFGLETEVLLQKNSDLSKMAVPFMMYVQTHRAPITAGHFVIVHHISDDSIDVIDGTHAGKKRYQRAKLSNIWDGVVIVPRQPSISNWEWSFCALGGVACLFSIWRSIQKTPRLEAKHAPT